MYELLLGVWLLFITYGCILCLIIKETSSKRLTSNPETSLAIIIPQTTWKSEVTELLDKLPLNGNKADIVEILELSSDPVSFMDYLESEIDSLDFEIRGRGVPFGGAWCKNRKKGGSKARPHCYAKIHDLGTKAVDYSMVYRELIGVS